MAQVGWVGTLGTAVLLAGMGSDANAQQIKTVFVIAMENHNWTQPANQFSGNIRQIEDGVAGDNPDDFTQ